MIALICVKFLVIFYLLSHFLSNNFQEKTHSVEEALEEPFECVNARIDALFVQVFFEPWQKFSHDFIMVLLESHELGKTMNEESVHGILGIVHQLMQPPKCVLLLREVHE